MKAVQHVLVQTYDFLNVIHSFRDFFHPKLRNYSACINDVWLARVWNFSLCENWCHRRWRGFQHRTSNFITLQQSCINQWDFSTIYCAMLSESRSSSNGEGNFLAGHVKKSLRISSSRDHEVYSDILLRLPIEIGLLVRRLSFKPFSPKFYILNRSLNISIQ